MKRENILEDALTVSELGDIFTKWVSRKPISRAKKPHIAFPADRLMAELIKREIIEAIDRKDLSADYEEYRDTAFSPPSRANKDTRVRQRVFLKWIITEGNLEKTSLVHWEHELLLAAAEYLENLKSITTPDYAANARKKREEQLVARNNILVSKWVIAMRGISKPSRTQAAQRVAKKHNGVSARTVIRVVKDAGKWERHSTE